MIFLIEGFKNIIGNTEVVNRVNLKLLERIWKKVKTDNIDPIKVLKDL